MINLIPPKAKKQVTREYWVRVTSVWAILIAIVAVVAALLLLPTYVLVQSQLSALEREVREQNDTNESFQNTEELVRTANIAADQLSRQHVTIPAHEVISAIRTATPNAVQPTVFQISRTDRTIETVRVQGTARSREALANFKIALERSPFFTKAAVPISNLAEETDLPFTIEITMCSEQKE